MCQGVQTSLFMRVVRVRGLELALALLRDRLVDALGLRFACEIELLRTVIFTRETVREGFLLSRTIQCAWCAGVIVVDPRWEPKPQD